MSYNNNNIISELESKFGDRITLYIQATSDNTLTFWIEKTNLQQVLKYLKNDCPHPYRMLYDLTAIDERNKK